MQPGHNQGYFTISQVLTALTSTLSVQDWDSMPSSSVVFTETIGSLIPDVSSSDISNIKVANYAPPLSLSLSSAASSLSSASSSSSQYSSRSLQVNTAILVNYTISIYGNSETNNLMQVYQNTINTLTNSINNGITIIYLIIMIILILILII